MTANGEHDTDVWPVDPWEVREIGLSAERLARSESVFALANGHLGLRGNLDEGEPRGLSGTYLNGFYESYPLTYGERGYGFAEDGQTVVNVPDGKVIHVLLGDEPLDVLRGTVLHHERTLNLREGTLDREVHWRSNYGREVKLRTRRLVSFAQRSVAAISWEIEAVDQPMRIAIQSNLVANQSAAPGADTDPRAGKQLGRILEPKLASARGLSAVMAHTTASSGLSCASGMDHVIRGSGLTQDTYVEDDLGRVTFSAEIEPGKPLRLQKFLAYHWSSRQSTDFLRDQVEASLANARAEGWTGLLESQKKILDDFWEHADVEVEGDPQVQQAVRFAMFHLLQAGARVEGRAIAAKGLTGPGYDGHAFWDTESFVLPVLTYVAPNIVRHALSWRHRTLPLARERAAQAGLSGATMPWRTIHGEECSGYWPAGAAAMHVNADIADAVRRYVDATGDDEFAAGPGGELLVESARMWCSFGQYDADGKFRIDGVTGPDEYSALVDNNVFTNLMAQQNLWEAALYVQQHEELARRMGVDEDEVKAWNHAADSVFVPWDDRLEVHPQDQDFTTHERWDFEGTAPEQYPLLLHFPYQQLYRKQVVKQADLVLAMQVRGDAFTHEQKVRNFAYYEALCVRDSSLSACTQAIVAAEVGQIELAYDYLREAALVDLHDLHRNTGDGLHIASLAGAVMAITAGLGGMRDGRGELRFRPRLPEDLDLIRFRMLVYGCFLQVTVEQKQASYELLDGEGLTFSHWSEEVRLRAGESAELDIWPAEELEPPEQPAGRAPSRKPQRRDVIDEDVVSGGMATGA